jgi:hypothetical protein
VLVGQVERPGNIIADPQKELPARSAKPVGDGLDKRQYSTEGPFVVDSGLCTQAKIVRPQRFGVYVGSMSFEFQLAAIEQFLLARRQLSSATVGRR